MSNKPQTPAVTPAETPSPKPESLDNLLEVLNADDLRHVIGGGRVKYPPFNSITQ